MGVRNVCESWDSERRHGGPQITQWAIDRVHRAYCGKTLSDRNAAGAGSPVCSVYKNAHRYMQQELRREYGDPDEL